MYVLAVLVLSACSFTPKVTTELSPDIDKHQVRTIVVLPFETLETPQVTDLPPNELTVPGGIKRADASLAVPPSGERLDHPTAAIPDYAADKVMRIFYAKLKDWEGIEVHAPEEAAAAIKASKAESRGATLEQIAAKVAAKMALDAAIVGRVLVYQERGGSKLGGETAAVGFEVKLISTDGEVLWTGNYYEKQKPFVEDAKGSLERGFVFVTAEELTEYGAEHLVRQFPFGARARR